MCVLCVLCVLFGLCVLWVVWGLHDEAYALIALQLCLVATNIRGAFKNEDKPPEEK